MVGDWTLRGVKLEVPKRQIENSHKMNRTLGSGSGR